MDLNISNILFIIIKCIFDHDNEIKLRTMHVRFAEMLIFYNIIIICIFDDENDKIVKGCLSD